MHFSGLAEKRVSVARDSWTSLVYLGMWVTGRGSCTDLQEGRSCALFGRAKGKSLVTFIDLSICVYLDKTSISHSWLLNVID